jgi:hypothetical protein
MLGSRAGRRGGELGQGRLVEGEADSDFSRFISSSLAAVRRSL